MTDRVDSTPAPRMQPGLPAFVVYDCIPEGCVAYPITDSRQAPLLRSGDWVVVDSADRGPVEGELFVLRWQSGDGRPQVVECGIMSRWSEKRGEPIWAVGARHRGVNASALGFGAPGDIVGDFGYSSEALTERFLGRVIGVLEPRFIEPTLPSAGRLVSASMHRPTSSNAS